MKDLYTIVNDNDEFIYLDLGEIKTDDRLPRRSTTFNDVDEAKGKIEKIKSNHQKKIEEYTDQLADPNAYHHEWMRYWLDNETLPNMRVVKITLSEA